MHKSETYWMHARGQPASARAWPDVSGQLRWPDFIFNLGVSIDTHPKVNKPPIVAAPQFTAVAALRRLAAGQARALAGWPRACIQSVSDLCMMHA